MDKKFLSLPKIISLIPFILPVVFWMIDKDFSNLAVNIWMISFLNLTAWWWDWEHKPDFYPKNYCFHAAIAGSLTFLPVLIRIFVLEYS